MENYRKIFKIVATVAFIGMVLFSNMLGVKNVYAYNSTIADHRKDKEFYVARRYTSVENGINSYPIRLFGPYQSSNPRATKTPDIKEWEIAYCINGYFSQTLGRGWAIPSGDQSTLAYAKMPYTQENVYRMVGDYDNVQGYNYHREVPLNIDQILKKILYIGYPYDAKNLQQNLGDRQFEQVTQAVIYNYTDHSSKGAKERDTLKGVGGEVYTAYQKMVDLIDNHFDELVMPSDFEVNIYEWYNHPLRTDYVSYQNLLTASISERRIPIKFRKVDNQNQTLSGARIQVINSDSGKDYGEWISGEDKVLNLLPGNYEFIEKSAPKGYEKAEKIVFRISNAGKVTYKNESGRYVDMPTDNGTYLLKMVDEKSSVVFRDIIFSKRNLNGDEIAGAQIQIKQDEEVVEQWTSEEGQSHQISLAPGIYTFHEEAAPKGYVAVTDFEFTVNADGTVEVHETPDAKVKDGKVVVTNQAEKKKVTFSKQDIAGKEIAGAQIQIKQGEEVVEKWTSEEGQSHQINLAPGSYTFHEETAPKGYVAVTDFAFTVKEDGTVEVHETSDAKVKDGKVVVTDQVEKKEVVFSKQDIAGKEIAGAQIELKQGEEVVASWTSKAGKSHKVKLAPGTYTFHEEAAPNGYLAVTDFTFTVKADGTVELGETSDAEIKDGKLVVTDKKKPEVPTVTTKKVVFSKQDIAGNEIAGAQIQIKQGEEVVEKWTSKEGQSHQISLAPGSYTFHEEAAPRLLSGY
ncbi:MAG TPA: thioester-forming surface-anchored protein [Candidatus Enterococcus stercoripullorum]|nr:thioester-forming surface-anchored protein [Candidatus Enterococcus stercoripullorum]